MCVSLSGIGSVGPGRDARLDCTCMSGFLSLVVLVCIYHTGQRNEGANSNGGCECTRAYTRGVHCAELVVVRSHDLQQAVSGQKAFEWVGDRLAIDCGMGHVVVLPATPGIQR